MAEGFQWDVFLSHSSKDKAVARPLAERLRKDGRKVWFDEWVLKADSLSSGERARVRASQTEEGLEHSEFGFRISDFGFAQPCMSAHAFGSDWAQSEAGTFRFRDPLNKECPFLPLRLDAADVNKLN